MSRLSALKSIDYRKFLRPLRQPAGIAALVSVGIHGILFAASPRFSSSSLASLAKPAELETERTVPLVELTPAEQQRLPDFSNQTFSLFPQPRAPGGFQLPSGGSPGSTSYFSSQPFPPSPFFDNSPIGNTGVRSNASGYSGGSSSGSTGQRTGTSSTNRQGQSGAQTEVGTQTQPNQTGRNTAATAGVDEITPAELERRTVDVDRLQIATRPSTQAGDLRTPGTADTRSPTGSNSATREGQAPSDLLRSELEAFQSAYTYSEAETSEAAAETALANWVTSVKENLEITELPLLPPIEIAITYPLRICLPVAPTAAKVGVLVSPNGEIASDPVLLKSTGYAGLNQKALQVTDTAEYSAGAAYRAYRFDVPVQYNEANCTDPQQLS